MTALLAAAVGRGYFGLHRLEHAALNASAPEVAPVDQVVELPQVVALPELVRQPELVTAASAHLSLVPVRRSPDPLLDTVPHPVVRLFPLPVADPVTVPDEVHLDEATGVSNALTYRSRHSA